MEQHPVNVPLFQAQDVVNAELPLALLHKEAVDIQQQDHRQQRHHRHADGHEHADVFTAPDLQEPLVGPQGEHDVKHTQQTRLGQDPRDKEPAVLADVAPGQFQKKAGFHSASLPVRSMVRVSLIFL